MTHQAPKNINMLRGAKNLSKTYIVHALTSDCKSLVGTIPSNALGEAKAQDSLEQTIEARLE